MGGKILIQHSPFERVNIFLNRDYKLCLCDFEKKLKVFKGTSLISDYAILDVPISMRVTYTEATMVIINYYFIILSSECYDIIFLAEDSIYCNSCWPARFHLSTT